MSKTKVIAFANNKGGSGKTTSCANIGYSLAQLGRKELLIDGDMQLNLSLSFFTEDEVLEMAAGEKNLYYAIKNQKDLKEYIIHTPYENLDLIPSSMLMSGMEYELFTKWQREFILRGCLKTIKASAEYDYILIDCPPSLGILTLNGLAAADEILIPMQCEYFALEGIALLLQTVNKVKSTTNPKLKIGGVFFTMYDSRTRLAQDVVSQVKSYFREKVFNTIIPRNVRLSEAPSHGLPICKYDANCQGAKSYENLAKEVIERG